MQKSKLFKKTPIALLALAAISGSSSVFAIPSYAEIKGEGFVDGVVDASTAINYKFIEVAPGADTDATLTVTTTGANTNIGIITKESALTTNKNIIIDGNAATVKSIGEDGNLLANLTVTKGALTVDNNLYVENISLSDNLTLKEGVLSGNLNFAADNKVLNLNLQNTVKGFITTTTNNTGAINILNESNFEKDIGSAEQALKSITITGDGTTNHFKGNVFVKEFVSNNIVGTRLEKNITADLFALNGGLLHVTGDFKVETAQIFKGDASFRGDVNILNGAVLAERNSFTFDIGDTSHNVTGKIDGEALENGLLKIASTTTFNDAIGSKNKLASIAVGMGSANGVAIFNDTVSAAAISIDGSRIDSKATFNKAVTGNVTAKAYSSSGNAQVTLIDGLTGTLTLVDTTTKKATAEFITNAQTITGAVSGTGHLKIDANTTFNAKVTAKDAIVTQNSSIGLSVADNAIGSISLADNANLIIGTDLESNTVNTGKIYVAENGNANLFLMDPASATYEFKAATIASATTAANISDNNITLTSSESDPSKTGTLALKINPMLNKTMTFDGANGNLTVNVSASADKAGAVAANIGVDSQVATSYVAADSAITALGLSEQFTKSVASIGYKKVAEQVAIQTDMLASTADSSKQTGSTVFSVAANRLASTRSGSQFSGIATGDIAAVNGIWARTFGNWTEQDTHDGSAGFEADTYGVAFGFDKEIIDNTRLGVLLSYAATDVDGKGAGSFQNDIDSYQFSLYGDYTLDTYYVEGMLGYATNKNKTSHIALGSTINADYDSNQWMARIGAGMPYMISDNMYVTPNATLAYTHISTDNYTEKGELSKYVQIDDVDSLVGSLDIKAHTNIETKTGDTFTPIVHAGVSYEFGDNNVSSTGNFVGQTNKFTMQSADSEELSGVFGAGVDYTTGQLIISAKYDATLNADSRSHNASIEARFEF